MKLKQSQIAIISLIVAILTLLVVAYTSLLPTIITGHENIECTNPNTGTIHLVGDLDSEITLDRSEYEEGSIDYTVSEVTFIVDTSTHSTEIEIALIDVSFGIILPGTSDPIYDSSWVFSFQEAIGGIKDYTFTNVYSDTISANSGDTIEVILVYDISGECTSIDPLDPLFPITRSPFPDTASFQADVISKPLTGKGTLEGIVSGSEGVKLSGASVELSDHNGVSLTTITTDSLGFYQITNITPDAYGWRITKTGYEPFEHTGRINADEVRIESPTLTKIGGPEPDSDQDGLPDDWELEHFGDLTQSGNDDFDDDGYTNLQEYQNGTNPTDPNDPPSGNDVDEEFPLNVVIPIIAAIPVTIIILGIPFTMFPIRLVIVTIIDGIIAAYVIFFSGVV